MELVTRRDDDAVDAQMVAAVDDPGSQSVSPESLGNNDGLVWLWAIYGMYTLW